jgi:hypothetical protein
MCATVLRRPTCTTGKKRADAAANLMSKDEAIAANIVKLPELLGRQQD